MGHLYTNAFSPYSSSERRESRSIVASPFPSVINGYNDINDNNGINEINELNDTNETSDINDNNGTNEINEPNGMLYRVSRSSRKPS